MSKQNSVNLSSLMVKNINEKQITVIKNHT